MPESCSVLHDFEFTDMGFGSKILFIVFIITFFLTSLLFSTTLNAAVQYNVNEEVNKVHSVKKKVQDVLVLEKLRSLLGLVARNDQIITPAPSHLPPFHRKHTHTQKERNNGSRRRRRYITAFLVSAGIGSLLCAFGLFWCCKKFIKKRNKTTSTVSIYTTEAGIGRTSKHAVKKVSSDPSPMPDLFYLDSLAAALDQQQICIKQNPISINAKSEDNTLNGREEPQKETIDEYCGLRESRQLGGNDSDQESQKETIIFQPDQDNDEYCGLGEIMAAHEGENVCNELCDNAHTSDEEAFYSLCNSNSSSMRFSLASASSISEYVEAISPKGSELSLVSSPTHLTTQTNDLKALYSLPPPPPPPPPPPLPPAFSQSLRIAAKRATLESASSSSSGNTPPNLSQGIPPPPFPPPLPKGNPCSFKSPSSASRYFQYSPLGKDGIQLPKLKPLHWDKVRTAPDRSTVWDKLKSSSFEFDEEMIESMFGYDLQNQTKNAEFKTKTPSPTKHVLEPKRLQNITILSKALNATADQVCDALRKGSGLSLQALEALAKMVLTNEEEAKLINYKGSINELGSTEKFVKAMLNIPFAFARVEAMFYKETFDDELMHLRKSFLVLEEACKELRSSRLFLKLLEAVLKTGNRMNVGTIRGGAKAFKLDALLKLADVKGTDGKTTLLHFVVQEIIRSEGFSASDSIMWKINQRSSKGSNKQQIEEDYRRMGLDLLSGLSTELCNVKKTATLDLDVLANSVSNLCGGMIKVKHLVYESLSSEEEDGNFVWSMKSFLRYSDKSLKELQQDENRVLVHVREITEYFHGDVGKDECNPLRIFVIVRDFLGLLDHVCKELRNCKTTTPNPLAPFS